MPQLTSREAILVKLETTYNTDPVPTASADAILTSNASWSHEGLRMIDRNVVSATDGAYQQIFGDTLKTITFDVELKGSGTIAVPPESAVLFQACGFTETIVVATSVTYEISSAAADKKSVTIHYFQDGLRHVITGARGMVSMNFETGNVTMATFTFTGHSGAPTDVTLPSPTVDATVPYAIRGAAFTIDGFSAVINALSIDMGLVVSTPTDMSASDGFGEVFISKRDVNGSFDPQTDLVANEDFYGNFRSGKLMALTTGVIGVTVGNRLQVSMSKVYYRDASTGDRDGIRTYELPFGAVETSGDDEISIVFT